MKTGFKTQCIPDYRLLTEEQIKEIHQATITLLEKTGQTESQLIAELQSRRKSDKAGKGSSKIVSADSPFAAELKEFLEAMDDDLNISRALAAVFEAVKTANTLASRFNPQDAGQKGSDAAHLEDALLMLMAVNDVLGVLRFHPEESNLDHGLAHKVEDLLQQRTDARKSRDFARADAIRDELASLGIEIKDTPEGTKWHRI